MFPHTKVVLVKQCPWWSQLRNQNIAHSNSKLERYLYLWTEYDTTETVDVGDSASGFQDYEKHEPFFTYLDHLLK
jgi:hypothetical protein